MCDSEYNVLWFKDGQELGYEDHRIIRHQLTDGKVSLEIHESSLQDTGYYSVTVRNAAGKATSSAQVTVDAPRYSLGPRRSLEDVRLEERHRHRLNRVHANAPQPIDEAPKVSLYEPGLLHLQWEPASSEFEPHVPTYYVVEMRERSKPDWIKVQQGITSHITTVKLFENVDGTSQEETDK